MVALVRGWGAEGFSGFQGVVSSFMSTDARCVGEWVFGARRMLVVRGGLFLGTTSVYRLLRMGRASTCRVVKGLGGRLRRRNCLALEKGIPAGCFIGHFCNIRSAYRVPRRRKGR